ncbi:hypothetical protein CRE_19798 [Caenorhabditis remanei]|uniref:Serpentine Receptor, class H n=1 Tax=Caenorhabditis remanei TaxID=31234 RepID=E3MTC7_CAERE|nr:hypothetical protein CRE_19798 [Caenorhabditis remanei]
MTYCSASYQFSYFNSVKFISLGYHILGAIAMPFHIVGAYCIIFKTPQTMSSVKWPMLNYHILTTLVDVMFGFMVCPYLIAPFAIMLPSGVLQVLGVYQGVQTYLIIMSIATMFVSMIQIVENRYMILSNGNLYWQKIRVPWFCFNYLLASLATLPMYLEIPKNQESAKSDIFAKLPCIPREIREDPALFVVAENMNAILAVLLPIDILIAIQFATFSRLSRLSLKRKNTQLSEMTIKLQRKFLRAYIIQIGCSFTFMVLPLFTILFEYFSMSFNQTVNNIALLMFASYGLSSTIMMLLVHSPYRKFLKEQLGELFGIKKMARNQTVNVVIPSVASMKSRINLT